MFLDEVLKIAEERYTPFLRGPESEAYSGGVVYDERFHPEPNPDYYKADILSAIATSSLKLGDKEKALKFLNESVEITKYEFKGDIEHKAFILSSLATIAAQLGDKEKAGVLLDEASELSKSKFKYQFYKVKVLSAIATSSLELGDKKKARIIIDDVLNHVEDEIQDNNRKTEVLRAIATSVAEVSDKTNDASLIRDYLVLVKRPDRDEDKYLILQAIISSRLAFEDIKPLSSLVSGFSDSVKAKALARILSLYSHPEFLTEENTMPRY